MTTTDEAPRTDPPADTKRRLVVDYLSTRCAERTLETLMGSDPEREGGSARVRVQVGRYMAAGEASLLWKFLLDEYPSLVVEADGTVKTNNVVYMILSQTALEMIREKRPVPETLSYMQEHLVRFSVAKYQHDLDAVLSLLTFPEPSKAPQAHLLGMARRSEVAAVVGKALTTYLGEPECSGLQGLVGHTLFLARERETHERALEREARGREVISAYNPDEVSYQSIRNLLSGH
ncbi:hypothetical protein KIPB_005539 [Kipferlia bialata]|uniref:CTLH/CRA C-terminal to LisH motif domain-containing protein n=1 Tax=Kipferlia bialata TaxID=797122 RepID=A0A9K3CXK4_9EUKA|nr:hypothetical protein KIPB_005539 [Kipferlia bialata]|eukprot:g5539.t1